MKWDVTIRDKDGNRRVVCVEAPKPERDGVYLTPPIGLQFGDHIMRAVRRVEPGDEIIEGGVKG